MNVFSFYASVMLSFLLLTSVLEKNLPATFQDFLALWFSLPYTHSTFVLYKKLKRTLSGPCSAVSLCPSLLIHVGVGVLGSLLAARLGKYPEGKTRGSSISLLQAHLLVHPSMHSSEVGIKGLILPMGCGKHVPKLCPTELSAPMETFHVSTFHYDSR